MRIPWSSALLLPAVVHAVDIRGLFQLNDVCNTVHDVQDAKVQLDGGLRSALIRRTGEFIIPEVDPGLYILSVDSQHFVFDQFLVDIVMNDTKPLVFVHPYMPGTPLLPKANVTLAHPMTLLARRRNIYFVPRESFNVVGMFNNPMMLLMIGTGVMMFAMPMIMNSMDPQALADAKQMQAKIFSVQNAATSGDIAGAFKQIAGDSSTPARPQVEAQGSTGSVSKGKKGKRR
ncbi:hypothetical protein EXIGLDRAFT_769281 [Exidia glandulosa HHB12029]|uniref:ER membrane protein complex subunit 7 beta-sandwich domain-containing protein n=1 Tax=Exidia glandulosa HHB12029 TaxID=1314781 RepID=A0A165HK77_EXIGL|nr:hypothetical protein EXIGLDRAFT_769281 [Exidia glandulosa HHB12029]